ncbi:MAG: class I SAM-dependent rRNA methyltransferase [Bacteroidales bacterium]
MTYTRVVLKSEKEQSLQRFHPWIFSGAIKRIEGEPNDGEVVEVYGYRGEFLALGHFQSGSIMVRVVSFTQREINREFWKEKLTKALQLRRSLGLFPGTSTNIFRLVHGEGDGMPGLIVDVYGSTAVMQVHSVGMSLIKSTIAELIVEITDGAVASVYDKSAGTLSPKAEQIATDGYLIGDSAESQFVENDNKFFVSWEEGQKTGFFIDQRENRQLLEKYCKDASVLNAFCYTGGFSVYAAKGGASQVVSVDSSKKAMELTTKNMEHNFGHNPKYQSLCTDVFQFLRDNNDTYDVIVLDPPAFAKNKSALRNALQAYKRLNAAAFRMLNPGGVLFTFSCSQVVTRDQFRNAVFSGSIIAQRDVRILHQLTQPADHPINIYHPEGEYLKGLVLFAE